MSGEWLPWACTQGPIPSRARRHRLADAKALRQVILTLEERRVVASRRVPRCPLKLFTLPWLGKMVQLDDSREFVSLPIVWLIYQIKYLEAPSPVQRLHPRNHRAWQ
jgi:hypothetical protein